MWQAGCGRLDASGCLRAGCPVAKMKIAVLSDIHANLPAFQAVLREVAESGADQIMVLGDVVGYGASPAECVELCGELMVRGVMGNHDLAALIIREEGSHELPRGWRSSGYLAGLVYAAAQLDVDQADWLSKLPYTREIKGASLVHARFDDPKDFGYLEKLEDAEASLEILAERVNKVGFCGHTHKQEVFHRPSAEMVWESEAVFKIPADTPCVVMVGSVGRTSEKDKRAAWVLWEPEERRVRMMRTDYQRVDAARQIFEADLPAESAIELMTEDDIANLGR